MQKFTQKNAITLTPGGGPTLAFMGMTLAYKVSAAETDGAWALLESVLPPRFPAPPLHWHETTQQGFYVLEGRVTFQIGAQIFMADPGASVSVPAHVLHTFCNQQDLSARLLVIIIPGGLENLFKELVSLTPTQPALFLKADKFLDLYQRYDTFLPEEK